MYLSQLLTLNKLIVTFVKIQLIYLAYTHARARARTHTHKNTHTQKHTHKNTHTDIHISRGNGKYRSKYNNMLIQNFGEWPKRVVTPITACSSRSIVENESQNTFEAFPLKSLLGMFGATHYKINKISFFLDFPMELLWKIPSLIPLTINSRNKAWSTHDVL